MSERPIILNKPNARISVSEAEYLLQGLQNLYNSTDSISVKKEIKFLVRSVLYVASETRAANYVSKSATELWLKNNMVSDLKNLTINKQRANKKKFSLLDKLLLEHCTPLSVLFDDIFEKKKDIKTVLEKELITAWVTKEEDHKLNKSGYKSVRPNGWKQCYADCGIEIK